MDKIFSGILCLDRLNMIRNDKKRQKFDAEGNIYFLKFQFQQKSQKQIILHIKLDKFSHK